MWLAFRMAAAKAPAEHRAALCIAIADISICIERACVISSRAVLVVQATATSTAMKPRSASFKRTIDWMSRNLLNYTPSDRRSHTVHEGGR